MNIIICGAGRVGFSISKQLSAQSHSVTVIDPSSEFIQKINETQDVKGIVGMGTYPSVLEKAGANETDMIIAVTRSDESNMVICQVAHSIFKIRKKIARIRSQEFLGPKWNKLYTKSNFPIDVIISPELEVAKSLQRKLEAPGALDNVPFVEGKVKVLEINIGENCPLINTPLAKLTEMFPGLTANILGVIRNEKFLILKKNDKMQINDKAFVLINTTQINKTLSAFGHDEKVSKKILIIGGGNIGFNLAKNLEESLDGARIKVIEKDKARAELIANELNSTIVIHGDGLDDDVLKEANIEEIETVLSLTNDDEDNIMASVLAEKFNPNKRTIALVNKQNYSLLQSSLKIDDLVDPRLTTVSTILKHVHKGTIETVYSLLDGEYEFIEAEVLETSELINKSIKESDLPSEIRIGAIVRKDKVIIPRSDLKFKKKDLVVFLTKRDLLEKVENLFSVSSLN
jgi:trk system potassium uptake protein TrkA